MARLPSPLEDRIEVIVLSSALAWGQKDTPMVRGSVRLTSSSRGILEGNVGRLVSKQAGHFFWVGGDACTLPFASCPKVASSRLAQVE